MPKKNEEKERAGARAEAEPIGVPLPIPFPPFPWFPVSGLYQWQVRFPLIPRPLPRIPIKPIPEPVPGGAQLSEGREGLETGGQALESEALLPWWFQREELRLDVDGRYPQMTASGTIYHFLASQIHWIAGLTKSGANNWTGTIWYKDGAVSSFPYTQVQIQVNNSIFPNQRSADVVFSGGGTSTLTRRFNFKSPYYHTVEFEFDSVTGVTPATSINTCDHPNRPATLPCENLNIETVFRRTGFEVTRSGDSIVPITGAGPNVRWSNAEMHDAMQTYWSRFADKAQWAMWTFFAALHEQGSSLGGIMFDDIGPNHRQGTAIFTNSFISNPPPGDPNPSAWVKRMIFWTACHEMGHSFNLAHSWQKQHPPSWGTPWIPLVNEPEARSFMNYPYNVSGGQTAFFSDFEFRFSDGELLFLRHAPARFVQMGNADWFDHHGFRQANLSAEPALKLELRVNRPKAEFEFLEPQVVELKLTNISSQPQLIDENILQHQDQMTVILKKEGKPARQFVPFAQYCLQPLKRVLAPGESIYESLFVSTGLNGWDMAEPGYYTVQLAVHLEDQDLVSNRLQLRVTPPRGYDEEYLAQDFFSEEVGRVLSFDGGRYSEKANDVLRETVERLEERRVAMHAMVALALPMIQEYKELDLGAGIDTARPAHEIGGKIKTTAPQADQARNQLSSALIEPARTAAESLGHIDYKYYLDQFSNWLDSQGESGEALKVQNTLLETLKARNVLNRVTEAIQTRCTQLEEKAKKAKPVGRKA